MSNERKSLAARLRAKADFEMPTEQPEGLPEVSWPELADIAALMIEAADALDGGDTCVYERLEFEGRTLPRVDPGDVARALGAEYVGPAPKHGGFRR